ncbi:cytochrome P450 [Mycolicibacterium austroafricanum]|uniref:cytochrome P450 n=1 Tax=Mycolicibacterium austroafricanum TaxID=39687 RepID=UPI000CF8E35E|nr:cytochrome P450 [Mycolicibacterium austroafricanum]PQP50775.1 cytochrome P450 [Mycolicibacterium austroafricanum]
MVEATTDPVRLPPGPRLPKLLQGLVMLTARQQAVSALHRRYGSEFTVNVPILGRTVVLSDPALVKDVYSSPRDLIVRPGHNLGETIGPGSTFSLEGDEHLERHRLLVPPFHGKRVRGYEPIIEEEVRKEISGWPEGEEFETLEPMMRITLNAILRAVFGAEGGALARLRELIPRAVALGSRFVLLPAAARRDLGAWSPGGRYQRIRDEIDEVINQLSAEARSDPGFEDRGDVLTMLLQARTENGEHIPDAHIADELVTMVVAGHETTATQLSWAIERLRRHPELLVRLTDEVDAGGSDLRQAVIWETQRTRPVIDNVPRRTKRRIRLGSWIIPEETNMFVSIQLAHADDRNYTQPESFDPDRYTQGAPKPPAWIPFGGGINRCVGAGFANMEMDVTLRTLLQELRFVPTDAPDEPLWDRGVALAPKRGGRAVVFKRHGDTRSGAGAVTSQSAVPPQ